MKLYGNNQVSSLTLETTLYKPTNIVGLALVVWLVGL